MAVFIPLLFVTEETQAQRGKEMASGTHLALVLGSKCRSLFSLSYHIILDP